jgi:hypothetical protein
MSAASENGPCAVCGVAEVSRDPGDGDQAFWITCEFSDATEHYLCHNDHYLDARADHVLSHHSPECIALAEIAANDTGAAHDDESARVIGSQLLENESGICICGFSQAILECEICLN